MQLSIQLLEKRVDSMRRVVNLGLDEVALSGDQVFNLNPALNIKKTSIEKKQFVVQSNSAILNGLITNLESMRVASLKETPLFQVIELPEYPLEKVAPNFKKLFIFSCLLTSIISSAILLLYRYIKNILI